MDAAKTCGRIGTDPAATLSATPAPAPVETTVSTETVPPAAGTPKAVPATTAAAPKLPAPLPAAAKPLDDPKVVTNVVSSTTDEVTPAPAPLDFDPKTLDRKQNARLEIDATRMPPDLDFTVEMNGKVYVRKTGTGIYKESDDLFVPPGVHEFRVTAQSGEVGKVSNTVSTDFRANKKTTMRIELRLQGMSANSGMPRGLYPGSQIVVTLK